MSTSVSLPEDVLEALTERAEQEHKSCSELAEELLRASLSLPPMEDVGPSEPPRLSALLPLIRTGGRLPGVPDLTPDELKQLLIDEELESALRFR